MLESLGIILSANMVFYIMVSFGFVVGIILMVSPEAFESLNKALQKEYGFKTQLLPKLESTVFNVIDKTVLKNQMVAGIMISVTAFALLMIYR